MKRRFLLLVLAISFLCAGCGSSALDEQSFFSESLVPDAIHMSDAFWDFSQEFDLQHGNIMTGDNAALRGIPSEDAPINDTVSYQFVNAYAAVYIDSSDYWVLVSFFRFDSAVDNIGWVRASDLMKYTEENHQLLCYPVQVAEGCVDLDTNEPVEWPAFRVEYVEDYAIVSREGGRSYRVSPSCIIYPEYE